MNITYDIIDIPIDISQNNLINDSSHCNIDIFNNLNYNYDIDNIIALQIDYDLNYNYSYLCNILEFYKIKKPKNINKEKIIKLIVDYEIDYKNKEIVQERKTLFAQFIELKNHQFFNKFIIGSL